MNAARWMKRGARLEVTWSIGTRRHIARRVNPVLTAAGRVA